MDKGDDRALLAACRAGDARAWERLLAKYERLVFSIPLNVGLSADDAADVMQLTFTILVESLASLREDSNLAAWLATVARRHTWRTLARKRGHVRSEMDPESDISALAGSQSDPLGRLELVEWLHQGLAALSERCRELLLALYFDPSEPSYAQVGKRLRMPVGSIGPTRGRCLERLKNALERGLARPEAGATYLSPPSHAPVGRQGRTARSAEG